MSLQAHHTETETRRSSMLRTAHMQIGGSAFQHLGRLQEVVPEHVLDLKKAKKDQNGLSQFCHVDFALLGKGS